MCAELRHCQRWVTNRERQRVPQWRTRDGKTSLSVGRRSRSRYRQIAACCGTEMTSATSGGRNRVAHYCKVDWCHLWPFSALSEVTKYVSVVCVFQWMWLAVFLLSMVKKSTTPLRVQSKRFHYSGVTQSQTLVFLANQFRKCFNVKCIKWFLYPSFVACPRSRAIKRLYFS